MALEDIINLVVTTLQGIPGSGGVLNYAPVAIRPEDIPTVFGGDQHIKVWGVTLDEAEPTLEQRIGNVEVLRKHRILFELWQYVTDLAVSEPATRALSEAAMTAVRRIIRTKPPSNIEYTEAPNRVQFSKVLLGNTMLCHYCRHVWTVHELIRTGITEI